MFIIYFRVEKEKSQIIAEISDVRAATDEVGRSKVTTKVRKTKI